ncbi:MAG: hypothetical protein HPY44_03175 [Armatimonadetes bacterium]|nr:hypothetical protein [Armatimonadota bacterium]
MSSVIITILCALAGLCLSGVCMARVLAARSQWESGRSCAPAVARWSWAGLVTCLAVSSLLMVIVALFHLFSRGMEGAIESSLSSRMSVYIGLSAYALTWLRERLRISWPDFRRRGPLLLPPASCEDPDEHEDH